MLLIIFTVSLILAASVIEDLFRYHGIPFTTWIKISISAALFITWKYLIGVI